MTPPPRYPRHIASLKPYVAGKPISALAAGLDMAPAAIAKLASNENPLGPSPRALEALRQAQIDISRYPDTDAPELTGALAASLDVPSGWIVTGAGSEALLAVTAAMLLEVGSKTAYPQYSFQAYANAAQRSGAMPLVVPAPAHTVDLDALARTLAQQPALVYIANPGNPTGTCVEPAALLKFIEAVPSDTVVLLDEAYYEFLPPALRPDSIAWVRRFPNLLVTRTFSKAYGLAGLRVGYAIAQQDLADMLRRVRSPFTVSEAAQLAATAALQDHDFLARTLENNQACRELLCTGLREQGIEFLPSHTNFVLARVGDGAAWSKRIERHGILVRPVNNYGLPEWVRITIGSPAETRRLLDAIRQEAG